MQLGLSSTRVYFSMQSSWSVLILDIHSLLFDPLVNEDEAPLCICALSDIFVPESDYDLRECTFSLKRSKSTNTLTKLSF